MIDKTWDNLDEIALFKEANKLKVEANRIFFKASVYLETPNDRMTVDSDILIMNKAYQSEGDLMILNGAIQEDKFPTTFKARFNDYKFDNGNLVLTGKHPQIGNYYVRLTVN